jgi:aminomethyltransferase
VFILMDDPTKSQSMWSQILSAGEEYGIQSVGLGARDSLRLEARMNLYGNEMNDSTKPHESGVAWTVSKEKSDFIGKKSMMEHKKDRWTHRLVGLEVNKRIARSHSKIFVGDTEIGEVTSGTKSPLTGKSIALARVQKSSARPGTVLEIDIRGKRVNATVVKGAFFTRDY